LASDANLGGSAFRVPEPLLRLGGRWRALLALAFAYPLLSSGVLWLIRSTMREGRPGSLNWVGNLNTWVESALVLATLLAIAMAPAAEPRWTHPLFGRLLPLRALLVGLPPLYLLAVMGGLSAGGAWVSPDALRGQANLWLVEAHRWAGLYLILGYLAAISMMTARTARHLLLAAAPFLALAYLVNGVNLACAVGSGCR